MDSTDTWNASCFSNDWIFNNSLYQWTITPYALTYGANDIFAVSNNGNVCNYAARDPHVSRPNSYLLSSVKVSSGSGTFDSPFELIP